MIDESKNSSNGLFFASTCFNYYAFYAGFVSRGEPRHQREVDCTCGRTRADPCTESHIHNVTNVTNIFFYAHVILFFY